LKNQDSVHVKAFHKAVRNTRWSCDIWGYWSYGGTEEQIISDLIADYIDWKIAYKIYGKLTGPWAVRNAVRNQVLKVLDKTIIAAVAPAWKAMASAVEALRPKIEPIIKEKLEPLFKLQAEISNKIQDGAMSVIDPILKEHVVPHLAKIVEIVKSPMKESFDVAYRLFEERIAKFEAKDKDEASKLYSDLDWFAWSYHMWEAFEKINVLYDPLWVLHDIFPDIYPWYLIWTSRDAIRDVVDNAIWTFQKRVKERVENGADVVAAIEEAKGSVKADLKIDGNKTIVNIYKKVLMTIVMPPFQSKVFPAVESILAPINDMIIDPFKEIIDINGMFEDIITNIVDSSVTTVLNG